VSSQVRAVSRPVRFGLGAGWGNAGPMTPLGRHLGVHCCGGGGEVVVEQAGQGGAVCCAPGKRDGRLAAPLRRTMAGRVGEPEILGDLDHLPTLGATPTFRTAGHMTLELPSTMARRVKGDECDGP
jgi:hypothetical protein